MVEFRIDTDCGNAPKRQVIVDHLIARVEYEVSAVTAAMAQDARWERVGSQTLTGLPAISGELADMAREAVAVLTVDAVLTHGKVGSINGRVDYVDGRQFGFCDVYEFTGHGKTASIKKIQSYWIPIKPL